MQPRERLDQRQADRPALRRGLTVAGRKLVTADMADDTLHHIEARAEDTADLAQVQHPWHRHRRRLERFLDPIFAHHVVRSREDMTERRAPQHDLAGVRRDAVSQIGLPAGDQRDLARPPPLVVEDLGEVRADDVGLGSGDDRFEPLRGRIGERGGHAPAPWTAVG